MKKTFLAIASILMLIAIAGCSGFSNRGTHELPFIGSANTNYLSFESVETTDSNTVLSGVVHFAPGYWIRLAETSAIIADGVVYPVVSAEGITLGEQVTMPDSGIIHFTMTFPAIPADVKKIDFTENSDGGWHIWDIDLTGKPTSLDNFADIPEADKKPDMNATLPEPVLAYGDSTTVRIHLLGYKPAMGDKLLWYANTLHGQIGADDAVQVDTEGNATVKLSIVTPVRFDVIGFNEENYLPGNALLSPGETMDLYVDTHVLGLRNMSVRDGNDGDLPEDYISSVAVGRYPDIRRNVGDKYFGMEFYSGQFGDFHMNGDEYTDFILGEYKKLSDSIDADTSLSEIGKTYHHAVLSGDLVYAAMDPKSVLARNYYFRNNWERAHVEDSVTVTLSPENLKAMAANIDFNDVNIVLSENVMALSNSDVWSNAGIDAGFLKAADLYRKAYKVAQNGDVDEELFKELHSVCAPMADEVEAHSRIAREKILASDAMINTVPDGVPADKVFETIIAPYKGKVVLVDLWNTWCGPCRAALAQNEPEKSGDLSSEDIVWVYLANETSPMEKYTSMIGGIKGIHYRLNQEQWNAICDRFDVDGIPFYILVDRSGKATGRPDLRDHSKFKEAILGEL